MSFIGDVTILVVVKSLKNQLIFKKLPECVGDPVFMGEVVYVKVI